MFNNSTAIIHPAAIFLAFAPLKAALFCVSKKTFGLNGWAMNSTCEGICVVFRSTCDVTNRLTSVLIIAFWKRVKECHAMIKIIKGMGRFTHSERHSRASQLRQVVEFFKTTKKQYQSWARGQPWAFYFLKYFLLLVLSSSNLKLFIRSIIDRIFAQPINLSRLFVFHLDLLYFHSTRTARK